MPGNDQSRAPPSSTTRRTPGAVRAVSGGAGTRFDELVREHLASQWAAWHSALVGVHLGQDPESVHDLRVAARRLDITLQLGDGALPAPLRQARPMLRRLMRSFGVARDLDVGLDMLGNLAKVLPRRERRALEPLRLRLITQRQLEQRQLIRVLQSPAIRQWDKKLTATLRNAWPDVQVRRRLAVHAAPPLIRQLYRRLCKDGDLLTADSSVRDHHVVRAHVRRFRYALELVVPLYTPPVTRMLRSLQRLQDRLGAQHDAFVLHRRLSALAQDDTMGLPAKTLFSMGQITERFLVAAKRTDPRFTKIYRKIRGARWRALQRAFEKAAVHSR
ncbi:MAG TPA: CHAD domain-containing protein [Steroidobacteraceae bacterium]|nr:CHAD domain-containing protein [Steroidobacteraceae bacterium]